MSEDRFPGEPARRSASEITMGRYRFGYAYRHVAQDQGPSIHVFGPVDGQEREVLRFDCFQKAPHYHLGFSYRNEPIIPIESNDPFAWAVGELRGRFAELIEAAGADQTNEEELAALDATLDQIADFAPPDG